jgi:hypothetical protein
MMYSPLLFFSEDGGAAAGAGNDETDAAPTNHEKSEEADQIKKDILQSRRAVKVMTGEEAVKVSTSKIRISPRQMLPNVFICAASR